MKKVIISLLFITSCSQFKNRLPSSKVESFATCTQEILNFKASFINIESEKYKKYNQYLNDLNYTNRERKMEHSIKNWMEIGERNITIEQMRHHGAFAKIKTSFELDSPYAIATSFEQLFKDVESSYFISLKSMKHVSNLKIALEKIENDSELSSFARDMIETYNSNHIFNSISTNQELEKIKRRGY